MVLLLVAFAVFNPEPLADESGHHLSAIRQFAGGDWSWPQDLVMWPTYHVVASLPARLFGADVFVLRAFSALMTVGALWLLFSATRHVDWPAPSDALLHFAWHPILFPFSVLVYTEPAGMLCVLGGVYLHVRRQYAWSAVAVFMACLIRQSNVVWLVLMMAWGLSDLWDERVRSAKARRAPGLWRGVYRLRWHLVFLVASAVVFATLEGFAITSVAENRVQFNIAQFYLFGLFVVLLWLPVWLVRWPGDVTVIARWAAGHTGVSALLGLAVLTAIGVSIAEFSNPHTWNNNDNYFRNFPLQLMDASIPVRAVAVVLMLMFTPTIVRFSLAQPTRRMLALTWVFSLLFLVPHSLVEPRYYIVPVFFLNFFACYTPREARRLTIWYGVLSAAVGTAFVIGASSEGGVW
ncbi:MAG: hypothetical protein V3V49_04280 [Candidatus Krumholzibacteria bacterium]